MVIRSMSFSTVSLIAIVPESECSTPTLTVGLANRLGDTSPPAALAAPSVRPLTNVRRFMRVLS